MARIACTFAAVYVFRRIAAADRGANTAPPAVEFLLLHRAQGTAMSDTWQPVYGRIKDGETAWQTGLRELSEETGLSVLAYHHADAVSTFYVPSDDTVYHCPCFAAEVAQDAVVTLNEEHDDFAWLTPTDAGARLIWQAQRRTMEHIVEQIVTDSLAKRHLRIPTDEG